MCVQSNIGMHHWVQSQQPSERLIMGCVSCLCGPVSKYRSSVIFLSKVERSCPGRLLETSMWAERIFGLQTPEWSRTLTRDL